MVKYVCAIHLKKIDFTFNFGCLNLAFFQMRFLKLDHCVVVQALMAPLNAILWSLRKLNTTVNLGKSYYIHIRDAGTNFCHARPIVNKGAFFSECEIRFSNLPISQKNYSKKLS